jgi:3-deoxy-7-phosphoheptulonate synthase
LLWTADSTCADNRRQSTSQDCEENPMLVVFNTLDEAEARALLRVHGLTLDGTAMCPLAGQLVAFTPDTDPAVDQALMRSPAVERVISHHGDAPFASREATASGSVVRLDDTASVGGPRFALIAGPCAVENYQQLTDSASMALAGGAVALRGGAFKPRTSPYSFSGLGEEGLRMLAKVSDETGLPVVTEVVDTATVDLVAEHAQILQIGTRNAQNFALLQAVGDSGKTVLLKRGFGCTVAEWLHAAEHVLSRGNPHVILCERGIRSFESATRFTLDLSAVAVVKKASHLPVVVDPSHGTGHRELVRPLALAAAAVGADGLLIDVHPQPAAALCDGDQALGWQEWLDLVAALRGVLTSVGRSLPLPGSGGSQ